MDNQMVLRIALCNEGWLVSHQMSSVVGCSERRCKPCAVSVYWTFWWAERLRYNNVTVRTEGGGGVGTTCFHDLKKKQIVSQKKQNSCSNNHTLHLDSVLFDEQAYNEIENLVHFMSMCMIMAHTHCTGSGKGTGQGMRLGTMGFYIMLLTLHTTQGQGQGQGTIFPIVPVPFPVPVPVLVPYSVYEPLVSRPRWFDASYLD